MSEKMKSVIGSKVKFDITPEEKPKKAPAQKKTEKKPENKTEKEETEQPVENVTGVKDVPVEKAAPTKKDTESVTIRISKEEKKAFKALCAVRGVNMSDLLSEIVREYIQNNK